jgi:hypothetical protein
MSGRVLALAETHLRNMLRQRSIIFSCFILPVVIIWSTWWITADFPMVFSLANDEGLRIAANMIDVHVVTGGLTAMGITAGLFTFILVADNNRISERLRLMGFSPIAINLGSFLPLLIVLVVAALVSTGLSVTLAKPADWRGIAVSIFLVTLVYSAFGNMVGTIFPKHLEGTLIVLVVSFIDLMLVSNPMGEGIYLQDWTNYSPGFIPVQISLESGFSELPASILSQSMYVLVYFAGLLVLTQGLRSVLLPMLTEALKRVGLNE